jgi:transcriptional regulator with XRE-family HTH domain
MPTTAGMRIDGEKLRAARLAKFLDIQEAAEKAGIHRQYWSRLERETEVHESRPSTVRRMAEALDLDPRELLED